MFDSLFKTFTIKSISNRVRLPLVGFALIYWGFEQLVRIITALSGVKLFYKYYLKRTWIAMKNQTAILLNFSIPSFLQKRSFSVIMENSEWLWSKYFVIWPMDDHIRYLFINTLLFLTRVVLFTYSLLKILLKS
jgi:uncharacterized membrane protein